MDWIEDLMLEKPKPVCEKGDFIFAAIGLEHGHINNMCKGLIKAGATLKWVYDEDEKKVAHFQRMFAGVRLAPSKQVILEDAEVNLIATAAIPSERSQLGIEAMEHGKDFFTVKTTFTTLDQFEEVKLNYAENVKRYEVDDSKSILEEGA